MPLLRQAAAIQAYETSVVEESAAQLSGSTGHSPAPKGADRGERDPISSTPRHGSGAHNHQHGAFGDPVASAEAALAAQQRQVLSQHWGLLFAPLHVLDELHAQQVACSVSMVDVLLPARPSR